MGGFVRPPSFRWSVQGSTMPSYPTLHRLPLLLCAAATLAFAQERPAAGPAAPPAAPTAGARVKLSVDHFDFGLVAPGTTVEGQIVIESGGEAALSVSRIGVQCDCARLHLSTATRPNVPIDASDGGVTSLSLAPGEKATLDLRIDTTKLATGKFSKRCLIYSSDADHSPASIPFTVEIDKPKPAVAETKPPHPQREADGKQERPEPASDDEEHRPAPTPAPSSGPPGKIECDSYKHSFPEAFRGEKLHHAFILKNSGAGDLTLQEIRNSCSCSAAELHIHDKVLTQEEIKRSKLLGVLKPGETAELDVELKTADTSMPGHDLPITKLVRVFSNDPTMNPLILTLEAKLVTPFTLEPERMDFGKVKHGHSAKASVVLQGGKLGDFKVNAAHSPNEEFMKVAFEKVGGDDVTAPSYRIDAELLPSMQLGSYVNHIELLIDHERVKSISIPLQAVVEPNVSFVGNTKDGSERIDFGMLKGDEDVTIEVKIENTEPKVPYLPTSVSVDAKPSSDSLKSELVEIEKGVKYVVKLTVPKTLAKARFFQGSLTINADHPEVPVKRISFRGWFKREGQ
jgi:HYDIN/CFA65/VesB family protein